MNIKKQYKEIFIKSLSINKKDFREDLKFGELSNWDSVGHMTLISTLEDTFDISIQAEDIIEFNSFRKGLKILKKYKLKKLKKL